MRDHSPAHTIVPLELDEVSDAPLPPPRTPPPPPPRIAPLDPISVGFADLDPMDAPDGVVVYLRQLGLVEDDEMIEVVTDHAPPVRPAKAL